MHALDTTTWHELAPALVREHLAQTGPGVVAEIGVWRGELSERLLQLPALTQLLMVDPWEPSVLQTGEGRWFVCGPGNTTVEMEESYGYAQKVATRAGGRACIIRRPSVDAAQDVPDGSLAAVLIDAQHFTDQVIADIRAWLPKLRPGGLIVGDDYGDYYPGVQRGVEAVFGAAHRVLGQTWWRIV